MPILELVTFDGGSFETAPSRCWAASSICTSFSSTSAYVHQHIASAFSRQRQNHTWCRRDAHSVCNRPVVLAAPQVPEFKAVSPQYCLSASAQVFSASGFELTVCCLIAPCVLFFVFRLPPIQVICRRSSYRCSTSVFAFLLARACGVLRCALFASLFLTCHFFCFGLVLVWFVSPFCPASPSICSPSLVCFTVG